VGGPDISDCSKCKSLLSRFTSEECQQILAADAQLLLAPLVSAGRRPQVHDTLHLLHVPQRCVVAHVNDGCDFAGRVESVWLNLDCPLPHSLLVPTASSVGEQFVDVFAHLAEIGLAMFVEVEIGADGHRPHPANRVRGEVAHLV